MFGLGRSQEEKNQDRQKALSEAGRKGISDFGPERDFYRLQGMSDFDRSRSAGVGAQNQMLGTLADRSAGGYGLGQATMQQGADRAAQMAASQALTTDGLSPAQAALLAQRGANQAMMQSNAQAAQIAAQEQQQADSLRAQMAQQMAMQGLQAGQIQLGANDAFTSAQMNAAGMYINPQAQGMMSDEQRKASRYNAIVGGTLGAGGSAIGGWLGGKGG